MKLKKVIFSVGVLTLCFSLIVFSQSETGIKITPEQIFESKIAGDLLETTIFIENPQDKEISVRVQGVNGELFKVLPLVDKIWVKIPAGETKTLNVRGYVRKSASMGSYEGNIILESEGKTHEIPMTLDVVEFIEKISLKLKIEPTKKEINPGEMLAVKTTITNLGHKKVDGEVELILVNIENDEEIAGKVVNFSVTETEEKIVELPTSKNISLGKYEIIGNVYCMEKGVPTIKASDTAEVKIKKPSIDIATIIFGELTSSRIILLIFILVIVFLFYFSYRYYEEEKKGKKRYLESILKSINFKTLPKSGPNSAFIGRIAETNLKAFAYLDELKTHTLVAGATGTGKTVAAQIIAEEALMKNVAVIVFDPTAQWTGFLRENNDPEIFKMYGRFGMRAKDARKFKGNIYVVTEPSKQIRIKEHMNPGEITIFTLNKLDSTQIETFMVNTIDEVYQATLEESPELKVLLVYEEIHRILPKFGGLGKGLTKLEKGAREFRKWGVGMILISQVLSDFVGEIKANIGTEIQLMTRYEGDLDRIKLKYKEDVYKSVVKAAVGEGMIQNSGYNRGNPYVIQFRPPLHSLKGLGEEELDKYEKYTKKLAEIIKRINELKKANVDVFDLEIELNLALDNLKEGMFGVVDLYIETLTERVKKISEEIKKRGIEEGDKAIVSEWDKKKEEILKKYERDLQRSIKEEKTKLEEKEEILKKQRETELKEIEKKRMQLMQEEREKEEELKNEKIRLERRKHILDLLNRYKEMQKILREDVVSREWEKLEMQRKELKELKEPILEEMREERKKREEERNRIMMEMKAEEEEISKSIERTKDMWEKIQEDERMIINKDRELCEEEWEMIAKIKRELQEEFKKRKEIRELLMQEQEELRKEKLKMQELEIKENFEKSRTLKRQEVRKRREEIKKQKDKLYDELQKIKEKWSNVLAKEREMQRKEEDIKKMERELERKRGIMMPRDKKEIKKKRTKEKIEISEEEFERFKILVDDLLGSLSSSDIQQFTGSDKFKLYEEVMSKREVNEELKKEFILLVDKMLEKLPRREITKFVNNKEKYSLYEKVTKWGET